MRLPLHSKLAIRSLTWFGMAVSLLVAGCCLIPSGPDGDGDPNGNNGGNGNGGNGDADKPPPQSVSVQAIVQTDDSVPGQSGATFTYFGNPVIDESGRVAFYAAYTGGQGTGGLYVWQNGTLQRIYDTDPDQTGVVPGMDADAYFGGFTVRWDSGSPHLAWGNNGRLLYAANVNGNPQPNALFRWRAGDGDVFPVGTAETLRAIIADSTEDFLPEFYHPGVSNGGLAIYSSRYSYFRQNGSFSLFNRGFFTTDGLTTEEIAVNKVPGQPTGATFSDKPVFLTTHNAGGEFLFQAAYESGEGDRGVYLLRSGEILRVIDNASGRSFPGLPDGARVGGAATDFGAIALGEKGDIAIDTTLTVSGTTRDTVLLWRNSQWHELQSPDGKYASNLLTGVNDDGQTVYLAGRDPCLSDGQTTVNLATTTPAQLVGVGFEWESYGGAVNDYGRALLRYIRTDVAEARGLVLWSGERWLAVIDATEPVVLDTIDVIFAVGKLAASELDRVGTVMSRPESNRPGLSGMLNNQDEFVFRAGSLGPDGKENTTDDEQAVFLGRGE